MTEAHKRWVGQIINKEFQLRQYLGSSESAAVFLTDSTDRHSRTAQIAAIKFIPANQGAAHSQLSLWNIATKLSHPHLIGIFNAGQCRLDDSEFIYVVMEYAEENLGQIIPERALTPAETREMLAPALDVLGYLHAKGFVHGRIKPANIMAVNDQLKLSSDGLSSVRGIAGTSPRKPGIYDSLEAARGPLTPASDVWSLGMTLVEVLTQRPPIAGNDRQAGPLVPETLPAPFFEIVKNCLVVDPEKRWGIAEIAAHLNPATPAARPARVGSAIATASPASTPRTIPPPVIPTPLVSPRPTQQGSVPRDMVPPPRPPAPPRERAIASRGSKPGPTRSHYIVSGVAALLVLAAILGGARLLNRHEVQTSPVVTGASSSSPIERVPALHSSSEAARPRSNASDLAASSPTAKQPSKRPTETPNRQPASPSNIEDNAASSRTRDASRGIRSDAAERSASGSGVAGEVLQQDVPVVSPKAKASIQGRVRVSIKVHVDSTGNVTGAEFVSPGPSKYFADLAMKSAQKWEFAPAKRDGQYVASDWILRYEFTSSGTKVYPQQTNS